MDSTAIEITFDKKGVCSFCHLVRQQEKLRKAEKKNKSKVLAKLKTGKQYDVLIVLSGGVDSSTALHLLVKNGINPYCYSIDNGWQSPEAQENIMRLVEGIKVPFYRYNIDLKKFTELQMAFVRQGLINAEIPSDHILLSSSYEIAAKYGIKYIISGGNQATESVMPYSWSYPARDLRHIKDVYRSVYGRELRGLPTCGILKFNYYRWIKGIRVINILDYYEYDRAKSIALLEKTYGYKPYGQKHEESVYTAWFQNFYLYQKFGIDKRKAHLSSLINSKQITREEAVTQLLSPPIYPELGIEEKAMSYEKRSHHEFKTDEKIWNLLSTLIRQLRKPYRRLTQIGKATKG